MDIFLEENDYVDFSADNIRKLSHTLFDSLTDDGERIRAAYEFVDTRIPHSADIGADILPFKASDVLSAGTGICFAKSNLLAALLRSVNIPTGFVYQFLTLSDKDDSLGYSFHGLNAVKYNGRWLYLDARGARKAVFSLTEPRTAFDIRSEYGEYTAEGIYGRQDSAITELFGRISSRRELWENLPQKLNGKPDII